MAIIPVGNLAKTILSNKMTSLNVAFSGISALDTYQTEREEGAGFAKATASAVFDAALVSTVGFVPYLAYFMAKEIPGLAVDAYQAYGQYSRQLGAMQKQQAFQNAKFNDTEQAYTMRQAGMAIAQRSKYNIQQAMLGNEAKYMMR